MEATQKYYLLVIEDDLDIKQMLTIYLSHIGYEVTGVTWADASFDLADEPIPNVFLLGVTAATLQDCYDVFDNLRSNMRTRHAAIFFVAKEEENLTKARLNKIAALEFGVDEYIMAPIDVEELRLRIRNKIDFAHRQALTPDQHNNTEQSVLQIVEDDHDTRKLLRIFFESQGYKVIGNERGIPVLEDARLQKPDLIILDIHLPDIDGYQVYRNLRTNNHTNHIPIVFLTQKDERRDKIMGLELGADDYITKPFDIDELKFKVETIIRRSAQLNETPAKPTRLNLNSRAAINEERLASLEDILKIYYGNLNQLESRAATYGINVPIDVLNQIDYFKEKIQTVNAEIESLTSKD